MRFLLCWLVAVCVAGFCSAQENASEASKLKPIPSLKELLGQISSHDEAVRSEADSTLGDLIWQLGSKRMELPLFESLGDCPIYIEQEPTYELTPVEIASWHKELDELLPQVERLLLKFPAEDCDSLWGLVLARDPTAQFLDRDGPLKELIFEKYQCWSFYSALINFGPMFAPKNEPLLASTVRLLNELDAEQRKVLDVTLKEQRRGLFGPTTFGIAKLLMHADRTQVELPSLMQLADPENPELLRQFGFAILSDMGPEAHPALPELRKLLKDGKAEIRRSAALTIAYVSPRECDPKELVEIAKLDSEAAKLLAEVVKENELEEGWEECALTVKQIRKVLELDKTNVGKRAMLRHAIELARYSDVALDGLSKPIERELESETLEKETQRLANLALAEIEHRFRQ